VGAYLKEADAYYMRNKLSVLIEKQVIVVSENSYYKVRIIGFDSPEDINKYLPSLKGLGLNQIWVLPVKKQEEKVQETRQQVTEEKSISSKPTIALQIGLFHSRVQALNAQKKISSKLRLPVEIVEQWDYYRVLVTGFYTREEAFKYYPELAGLGYSLISVIVLK
jgi:cell division protein FtsN